MAPPFYLDNFCSQGCRHNNSIAYLCNLGLSQLCDSNIVEAEVFFAYLAMLHYKATLSKKQRDVDLRYFLTGYKNVTGLHFLYRVLKHFMVILFWILKFSIKI